MEEKKSNRTRIKSKTYHHGNLKEALIKAGQDLLGEEGVEALDLRKVARKAGVSHTAPYRHFADKEALYVAILEKGFQRLADQIKQSLIEPSQPFMERLSKFVEAYLNFGLGNPLLMREMYSGIALNKDKHPDLYSTYKASFFFPLVEIIKTGQKNQEVAEGDPVQLTLSVWSMMHGLVTLLMNDQIMSARPAALKSSTVYDLMNNCLQVLNDGLRFKK